MMSHIVPSSPRWKGKKKVAVVLRVRRKHNECWKESYQFEDKGIENRSSMNGIAGWYENI